MDVQKRLSHTGCRVMDSHRHREKSEEPLVVMVANETSRTVEDPVKNEQQCGKTDQTTRGKGKKIHIMRLVELPDKRRQHARRDQPGQSSLIITSSHSENWM